MDPLSKIKSSGPRPVGAPPSPSVSMKEPSRYGSLASVNSANSVSAFQAFVVNGEREQARAQAERRKERREKGRIEKYWEYLWTPCCGVPKK